MAISQSLFKNYEGCCFRAKGRMARQPAKRVALICSDPTKENTPCGSSTEEQRRQTAFCPKTLRAAGLLSVARVGSVGAARCGDAPTSQSAQYGNGPLCGLPWPQPKSLAAAPLVVFKQALSNTRLSVRHYYRSAFCTTGNVWRGESA